MIDNSKEYIICAAIWYKDAEKINVKYLNIDKGIIFPCLNHDYSMLSRMFPNVKSFMKDNTEQGFLTSKRRFVDRKEGSKIAFECGQIKKDDGCLFSEDLY